VHARGSGNGTFVEVMLLGANSVSDSRCNFVCGTMRPGSGRRVRCGRDRSLGSGGLWKRQAGFGGFVTAGQLGGCHVVEGGLVPIGSRVLCKVEG
jgi:hypothetical protein